jgi:hypothetical protein
MKKSSIKTNRNQVHTPKSPKGMGDYYGTGVKQKIGRIRDSYIDPIISNKQVGTPPKSLA